MKYGRFTSTQVKQLMDKGYTVRQIIEMKCDHDWQWVNRSTVRKGKTTVQVDTYRCIKCGAFDHREA